MKYYIALLYRLRNVYFKNRAADRIDFYNTDSNELIYNELSSEKSSMIARFGSTELNTIIREMDILSKESIWVKSIKYIKGEIGPFWNDETVGSDICMFSGFFPNRPELINQFYELMLECSKNLDILGSWLSEEKRVFTLPANCKRIPLQDLEPYYYEIEPWSRILKGKNVLVIHPFENSIKLQYQKRELLFANKDVLPEFNLQTIRAVQSIAGNPTSFKTWFDALEYMKSEILKYNFDIAIIGCGAYGFPLASYIKSIGKKSIHLGGATQILFGIKGRRWDDIPEINKHYNEHWIYPAEKVENYQKIENGCYW